MSSLIHRLAIASATVLLLSSCGSDDPDDSTGSEPTDGSSDTSSAAPSHSSDPTDATDATSAGTDSTEPTDDGGGTTVTRASFCSDLDPAEVGGLLGLEDLAVINEAEPGAGNNYWTCTIGQTAGTSVGVTFNILDAKAKPSDATASLDNFTGSLGPKNCTNVGDESLGEGTRGIDCSGTSSGIGFSMVARSVVVGDTQIDCQLASYSPDDVTKLRAAAPTVCALFRDLVVS